MPGFVNSGGGYGVSRLNLSSLVGEDILFRWRQGTDESGPGAGWYIDDISVYYYGNLPVELNSFAAKAENSNILLNWKTASEINNIGFEVQRSKELNSLNNGWQTLGFVKGRGTSVTSLLYSFTDRDPLPGKQYYRIKQDDANGTFSIYGPVEADNFAKVNFSLEQNYPNPFNPNTVIKYTIPSPEIVTIKLYNVLGSEAATLLNEYKEAGMYSLNFSSSELNSKIGSGVYFYTIKAGQFTQTRKMVILK